MASKYTIFSEFKAIDKMTKPLRKMTSGVDKFGQRSAVNGAKASRSFRGVSKSLKGVLRSGLAIAGLTIGAGMIAQNAFSTIREYDGGLKSLQAITGATTTELSAYEDQILSTANSTYTGAAEVAKGFELVGSAKPELLSSAEGLAEVTKAAITLKQASGEELADTTASLTNVLNQFDLAANQSARAMNVLAAASVVGDTKIMQTSDAFKVAGSEAKMSGLNIEELSGTIATLSKFGFKGAEAGTKFRNILSKMSMGDALPKEVITRLKSAGVNIDILSDSSVDYMSRLKELKKIQGDSAALTKMFGSENKGVAAILLENVDLLQQNIDGVTGTSSATKMAATNMSSLDSILDSITATWKNYITQSGKATGGMKFLKGFLLFIRDNLGTILNVIIGLAGAIAVIKGLVFAVSMWKDAQMLLNIALNANPIGLIVIGIAALIALVYTAIKYWDDWGAAISFMLGPIRVLLSIIMSLKTHWSSIVNAFADGGIVEGIKRIGVVLIDAVLKPFQQILELASNIPGLGELASSGAMKIQEIRQGLDLVSPEESKQKSAVSREEKLQKSQLDITLNNQTPAPAQVNQSGDFDFNMFQTTGF